MEFKVPRRELDFVLQELYALPEHSSQLEGKEAIEAELLEAILEEASKFAENDLAQCYQSGDAQGCQLNDDGTVTTPDGFREAYNVYVEGGWPSLAAPAEYGGQNLCNTMHLVLNEICGTANWSWSMYPELSQGARHTIADHGTQAQRDLFLPKLISGEWTGTMCLTEPHAGTDLGMIRTRAEPIGDGRYKINGGKIFISAGDHDMADNIVHIVLAKLPGAAAGSRGISTFIVSKNAIDEAGNITGENGVSCGRIEEKMGIHGNATCAINFDNAEGVMLGDTDIGLKAMFTFMNLARLGTSVQGLAHCERAYQAANFYAHDRLQSRSLTGVKCPDKAADPIIVHPDVRRMVLTTKSMSEGLRALIYYVSLTADLAQQSPSEQQAAAAKRLALMTPILKAFATEQGVDCASLAIQVMGGHGYITEWGVEQNLRDARIGTIYEGTTGVQALDLVGRKLMMDNGKEMRRLLNEVAEDCRQSDSILAAKLWAEVEALQALSAEVMMRGLSDRDELGAASVDYLMHCGYVLVAWQWLKMADLAAAKNQEQPDEFYQQKLDSAAFYFAKILPRTHSLRACINEGASTVMQHSALALGGTK